MGNKLKTARSSGVLDADGQVVTVSSYLVGFTLFTNGTNDATISLYNGTSAVDANALVKAFTVKGANNYGGTREPFPLDAPAGIYADITGTGATVIVYYAVKDGG